ncbi:alpha/beta-hydrolase family protein [Gordonia otitidis]|uniref:alpha/beta-hydrolase family protein n=1 Tax=Gordonia otitidis TaxID=249058 RepID=UPI001D1345CA|nr:alpha/beta-hydrolase family protein [Gordonia otitidis]UEA58478.1 alpha/beta-hydrolase family protein [Gordonia otitidis]
MNDLAARNDCDAPTLAAGRRTGSAVGPLHPAVACAVVIATVVGLWPSPLPRTPWLAGTVVSVCAVLTVTCTMVWTAYRRRPPFAARWWPTVTAGSVLVLGAAANMWWQNGIRAELGYDRVGIEWIVALVVPTTVVVAAIVWLPRQTAVAVAGIAAVVVGLLTPTTGQASASGSSATLQEQITNDRDARALVERWVDEGGLDDDAVLVAVPTGSGWVDTGAVDAIADRVGRMHTISPRYASVASWRAFVTARDAAGRASVTLLSALTTTLETVPAHRRPRIVLYGQSLGAIGAEAARVWADEHRPGMVWATVLSGVPADTIATHAHGSSRTVIANATDPVTVWSPAVSWRAADRPADTVTVGRQTRHLPWLPLVTFVQTSADLLGSLDGPVGVGHRYRGTDQVPPVPRRAPADLTSCDVDASAANAPAECVSVTTPPVGTAGSAIRRGPYR